MARGGRAMKTAAESIVVATAMGSPRTVCIQSPMTATLSRDTRKTEPHAGCRKGVGKGRGGLPDLVGSLSHLQEKRRRGCVGGEPFPPARGCAIAV